MPMQERTYSYVFLTLVFAIMIGVLFNLGVTDQVPATIGITLAGLFGLVTGIRS